MLDESSDVETLLAKLVRWARVVDTSGRVRHRHEHRYGNELQFAASAKYTIDRIEFLGEHEEILLTAWVLTSGSNNVVVGNCAR